MFKLPVIQFDVDHFSQYIQHILYRRDATDLKHVNGNNDKLNNVELNCGTNCSLLCIISKEYSLRIDVNTGLMIVKGCKT